MDKHIIVNEKEGKVVVRLSNCKDDAIKFITEKNTALGLFARLIGNVQMKNSFVGEAICHPEDTFDRNTGIIVAMAKARRKYNSSMFKAFQRFATALQKQTDILFDDIDLLGEAFTRNTEYTHNHVAYLTGAKEED